MKKIRRQPKKNRIDQKLKRIEYLYGLVERSNKGAFCVTCKKEGKLSGNMYHCPTCGTSWRA